MTVNVLIFTCIALGYYYGIKKLNDEKYDSLDDFLEHKCS